MTRKQPAKSEEQEQPALRLEWRTPQELAENPRNWRLHGDKQKAALVGTLQSVGWAGALLFNEKSGKLIDGHLRRKLALEQGSERVPVLVGSWTEAQERIILASLDPIAGMAETDDAMLKALIDEVSQETPEMAALLEEISGSHASPAHEEETGEIPEPPAEPFTKPGDLWILGKHRLLCGDSTSNDSTSLATGGRAYGVIVFDPPWESEAALSLKSRADSILAFADGGRIGQVIGLLGAPAWLFVWDCVTSWYAPNRPLRRAKHCLWYANSIDGYDFNGSHYGDAGEEHQVSNTRGSYTFKPDSRGKHLSDVFQRQITVEHKDGIHPHSKPLDWIRMLIGNCSTGDCLDLFVGSGRSILACEQLGRSCYGIEIDPGYCDVAVMEWEKMTGKKAVTEAGRSLPPPVHSPEYL